MLSSYLGSPPSFPCLPGKLFLIFQDPDEMSASQEFPWLFQGKLITPSFLLPQRFDLNSMKTFTTLYSNKMSSGDHVLFMSLSPAQHNASVMVGAQYISKWTIVTGSYLLSTYYVPSTVVPVLHVLILHLLLTITL